MTKSGGKEN